MNTTLAIMLFLPCITLTSIYAALVKITGMSPDCELSQETHPFHSEYTKIYSFLKQKTTILSIMEYFLSSFEMLKGLILFFFPFTKDVTDTPSRKKQVIRVEA
jgi:hypothetical protein